MRMKRVFGMIAVAFAVAFAGTSCMGGGSEYEPQNTAVVSIVDGDALTGMYAIFDDNKKAYIDTYPDDGNCLCTRTDGCRLWYSV